jgi:hypothetical protein
MATATPLGRRGPRRRKSSTPVAQAGRATIRSQHQSSLRARRGRSLPWCGELKFRTLTRHLAPNQEPERILIPGDGAAGDQGLRIDLPARRWRLPAACGLSRLNDFLALWSQAYMPSCNRQVTSTSIRTAKTRPGCRSSRSRTAMSGHIVFGSNHFRSNRCRANGGYSATGGKRRSFILALRSGQRARSEKLVAHEPAGLAASRVAPLPGVTYTSGGLVRGVECASDTEPLRRCLP